MTRRKITKYLSFALVLMLLFAGQNAFAKKKKKKGKVAKIPKDAIMLTYKDVVDGLMLKKALKENVITQEQVDALGAEVSADPNFKCYYLPASDAKELAFSLGAAKLNGLTTISIYVRSKYWQALKGAGRSMLTFQETVNAVEDLENEDVKITLTEEQINELKNLDDDKKAALKTARAYNKFIKILNTKTAANITAMSASGALMIRDLMKQKKIASIKIIRYGIVNLKSTKATKDQRKKNRIALEKVEEALDAAGIVIE